MTLKEDMSIPFNSESNRLYPNGKTYLFFIAVDEYKNKVTPLSNAVRDAQAISNCLIENYQLESENLILLTNEKVTKKSIMVAFDKYLKLITNQDNFIFYFSGHGTYDATIKTGYWLTHEAESGNSSTFLSNDVILSYIRNLKARHIFGIVDACFSSALFNDKNINPLLGRLYNLPSRWLLTAGRLEPVSDGSLGGHSPFAKILLDHLKYHNAPSLWINELCTKIIQSMVFDNANQLPRGQVLPSVGDKGGGFILTKKGYDILDLVDRIDQNQFTSTNPNKDKLEVVPTTFVRLAGKDINDIKDELEDLITDAEWQTVFNQLRKTLIRGQKRITLIQLIQRYNDVKKSKMRRTDTKINLRISSNQIQSDLLYYINDLRDKDLKN